jgi:hypothetical protein
MRSFEDRQTIRARHKTKHHFEGGKAWSSCSCGWESEKLDSYHSYQMTESMRAGEKHVSYKEHTEEL